MRTGAHALHAVCSVKTPKAEAHTQRDEERFTWCWRREEKQHRYCMGNVLGGGLGWRNETRREVLGN